jgi:hypothetical protein
MAFNEASESTRREYAARMNRVVDHIQTHLDVPLDLEQLALRASAPSTSIASSMHGWTKRCRPLSIVCSNNKNKSPLTFASADATGMIALFAINHSNLLSPIPRNSF